MIRSRSELPEATHHTELRTVRACHRPWLRLLEGVLGSGSPWSRDTRGTMFGSVSDRRPSPHQDALTARAIRGSPQDEHDIAAVEEDNCSKVSVPRTSKEFGWRPEWNARLANDIGEALLCGATDIVGSCLHRQRVPVNEYVLRMCLIRSYL